MLEYETSAALALLDKNFEAATRNLATLRDDMDFLRTQCTTTEVNMARIYNWDVAQRRRVAEAAAARVATAPPS